MLKLKRIVDFEDLEELKFEKGKKYWNHYDISISMETREILFSTQTSSYGPMSHKYRLPDVLLTMFERGMIERG